MTDSLEFTPYEIHRDWTRFSSTWVTVTHSTGESLADGQLLELAAVYDPQDSDERVQEEARWDEMRIEYNYLDNETMRMNTYQMGRGDQIHFCPSWSLNGYANIPTHGPRQETPSTSCVWVSLSAARQYRYGLSTRAFEARGMSMTALGRTTMPNTRELFYMHANGPSFAATPTNGAIGARGLALSPSLALHPVSTGVSALCHNARRILGWHIADRGLFVEETARPVTRHLENVTYVPTDDLVALWQTTILPGRFSVAPRAAESSASESTGPMERASPTGLSFYDEPQLRPSRRRIRNVPVSDSPTSVGGLTPNIFANPTDWESWVRSTVNRADDGTDSPDSPPLPDFWGRNRERGDT